VTKRKTEDFDYHAWTSEKALNKCSPEAEGAWIRTLSTEMWPKKTGEATNTLAVWTRLWRTSGIDQSKKIISEFRKYRVCNVSEKITDEITLVCRRLEKHYSTLDQGNTRQLRHTYKNINADDNAVLDIYEAYPAGCKRGGKTNSLKAIVKAIRNGSSPRRILSRTKEFAEAVGRCSKDEKKFVPHVPTFFNGEMWDDDTIESWKEKAARFTRDELPVAKPFRG
jgi:hypothetical protein